MINFYKKLLLCTIETEYGVDAEPNGSHFIEAENLTILHLYDHRIERAPLRPFLSTPEPSSSGSFIRLEFNVHIQRDAQGNPSFHALMLACGFTEHNGTYIPDSYNKNSLSIYLYIDGILHKIFGAKGFMSCILETGQHPYFTFKIEGIDGPPMDAPPPSITLPNAPLFSPPLSYDNTPTAIFHGCIHTPLEKVRIQCQNTLTHKNTIRSRSVEIINRNYQISLSIECLPLNNFDIFQKIREQSKDLLHIIHGTEIGNIFEIHAPSTKITAVTHRNAQGITMLDIQLSCIPINGDDEISFIFH